MKGDAYSIGRFGYSIYGQAQGGVDVGPLAGDAVAAIESEMETADAELKPLLYNTVALLNNVSGKIEAGHQGTTGRDRRQRRRSAKTPAHRLLGRIEGKSRRG